jgi:hypothetical protein
VTVCSRPGQAEDDGCIFDGQPGKVTQFDDSGGDRILSGKPRERPIQGEQVLIASRNGEAGPIRLTPIEHAGLPEAQMECGDEGAVSPSDGRASLAYEAPPADTNTVDPWEQRGSQAEER